MNITLLETLCKQEARNVFERFKYALINNPFNEVCKQVYEGCLDHEVLQVFGSSVLKKYLKKENLSNEAQVNKCIEVINYYKNILISTCETWAKRNYFK